MAQPRLRLDFSPEAARRVKSFAIWASCSTPLALQTLTQTLTREAALSLGLILHFPALPPNRVFAAEDNRQSRHKCFMYVYVCLYGCACTCA